MGLGSIVRGAAKIGSGALKAVTGALSGGSSNWLPLAGSVAGGAISALGGAYAANRSSQIASNLNVLNYKQAKEFAQNQIQWRVLDAKRAGLHPLAALGVSPIAAPPSAIGGDVSGLGQGLSEMGQNISRSIDAFQSRRERDQEMAKQEALNMLRYKLELDKFKNDQLETQSRIALNNARAAAVTTEMKNAVRGASLGQPRIPARPVAYSRGRYVLPGGNNAMTTYKGPNGENIPMPSESFEASAQNMWGIPEIYLYGSLAFKKFKDYASRYGRFMREYHNSRGGNIYE